MFNETGNRALLRIRITTRTPKLGANPAPSVTLPSPNSASTISGLRPNRSERTPANGAEIAQVTAIAAASSPACPSETSSSRLRSTSSGPSIVTQVANPKIAIISRTCVPKPAPPPAS